MLYLINLIGPLPTLQQMLLMLLAIWANDLSWALYIRRVGDGKAFAAGRWATSIWITGSIAAVSYIANHWLIAIGALATFSGTIFSVWLDSRKKKVC